MKVFISYRRANGGVAFAYILHKELKKLRIDSFYDQVSLHDETEGFPERIKNEIKNCDYFILLCCNDLFAQARDKDWVLEEIQTALDESKKFVIVPLNYDFSWDKTDNLPSIITEKNINHIQQVSVFDLSNIDSFLESLVKKLDPENVSNIKFLMDVYKSARKKENLNFYVNQKDIINIDLYERWDNAKRVSLVSFGAGGILRNNASCFIDYLNKGVEFRFLNVDPDGASAEDIVTKKRCVYNASTDQDYLTTRLRDTSDLIKDVQKEAIKEGVNEKSANNIQLKVTGEHITMTIQWVENNNDSDSYFFIEFLPNIGIKQDQGQSPSCIVMRQDSAYDYFKDQFEILWNGAKTII